MTRKSNTISINVLSVLIILMSLFIGIVGHTNAWFTAKHDQGVQIVVQVGDLTLSLYQKLNETTTNIVYSYDNNSSLTAENKKFITLSGGIVPDTPTTLNLIVANDDPKSVPMYIRFKFELYVRGVEEDTLIPTTISGFTAWTSAQTGFKKNDTDGFYYFTSADGSYALLEKEVSQTLMEDFTFNYTDMFNEDGDLLYTSSDAVYIKLIVDGSATAW